MKRVTEDSLELKDLQEQREMEEFQVLPVPLVHLVLRAYQVLKVQRALKALRDLLARRVTVVFQGLLGLQVHQVKSYSLYQSCHPKKQEDMLKARKQMQVIIFWITMMEWRKYLVPSIP